MKNYNEMANSLFNRRDKYVTERNIKRKRTIKIAATVCSFCIVALIAFGIFQTGILKTPPVQTKNVSASNNNSPEATHQTGKNDKTNAPAPDNDKIIWGENNLDNIDEGFIELSNKNITSRLWEALKTDNGNDNIYAIMARPFMDETFVYQGKTIAEHYAAMNSERNNPELLSQLLKDGDSLKYGKTLYETGTPSGEKWTKEFYDERVAYYGSDMLEKYIVNGQFLREKLEQDLSTAFDKKEATAAYDQARIAYLEALAKSLPGSYSPEVNSESKSIVLYLTKSEFDSFTANNIEEWTFDLAAKPGSDEEYVLDE